MFSAEAKPYRYRNTSDQRRWIRRIGVEVDPGEEFDSPIELSDSTYRLVPAKKEPAAPAKERP